MKKLSLLLFTGIISCWLFNVSAQSDTTITENFDGNTISFTSTPANAWSKNSVYNESPPYSYRGRSPNTIGDTILLTTPIYDFSNYSHVQLRFNHICKISPQDKVSIEYKLSNQAWKSIPATAYNGEALNYNTTGFNAASYTVWQANDSTAIPAQSWWKGETFDISLEVSSEHAVQFRFIIQHGSVAGTHLSYGWLLDDFEIIASAYEIKSPTVKFLSPFVQDTVYSTGPWRINAKVKTQTVARIENPWLKYTATQNGTIVANDSVLMDHVQGDSLWEGTIPQFLLGMTVQYTITGQDTIGNYTTVASGYIIVIETKDAIVSNSATIYSIDIDDTIAVLPNSNIPVLVTIKNKGISNLDSVNVSYVVNGSTPVTKSLHFNPALPWDFNYQDTLGYYNPKVNGFDTIVVWTSMPNGQFDSVSDDDTLTKIIYGSSDIAMHFINPPADTVYNIGPFEITTEIFSLSGASTGQISLYITSLFNGNTALDTLMMLNISGNLWKATIPQKVFGTDVSYAIKLTDILGNSLVLEKSYYIKRPSVFAGEVIVGRGTTIDYYTPVNLYYNYSFSRQLYLGTEFSPGAEGGIITKLAWDYASTTSWNITNQYCYFKVVDDAAITTSAYIDPIADGATLVWSGNLSATGAGWIEITLATPFVLPPGKNLLIYWNHQHGTRLSTYTWRHTTTSFNSTARGYSTASFTAATTAGLSLNTTRPNARFYIMRGTVDSNSVAMVSIDSPEKTEAITGMSVPVRVTIRNKGIQNLDSCIINWSLNGQIQPFSTIYYGNLLEDFTDTITVGSYIPAVISKVDTVVVWVSMPNGKIDSTTYDDTLTITSLECASIFSGTVSIGVGGAYASVNDALNTMRDCGVGGNVTLALKGTFNENINLSNFSNYMNGYSLSITSLDNHADSAIIQPPSGVGITLSNMRNLILKNITIDVATSGTNAIQFTGACTNIVIRDCKLLANPTATTTTYNPVYRAAGTGTVDSIFFINNLLNGGNWGFYFVGGSSNGRYGTNVIFDSNTLSNQYSSGIYPVNTDFTSCSYNTILSRTANTGSTWNGLNMQGNNGPLIGNRIIQRSTGITQSFGINIAYHNYYLNPNQNRALIANNEIILSTTNTTYGIYASAYSKSEILHNSIYISGTGNARGIHLDNSITDIVIKNNNIVIISPTSYSIFFNTTGNLNQYDIDYNNYYASYIGYYGGNISNMTVWQAQIATDQHSVSILPNFINSSNNLKYTNEGNLYCNRINQVSNDIENTSRTSLSAIGCYEFPLLNVSVILTEITGLRQVPILSQTDSVKVIVHNMGSTPLASINLEWSINGTSQKTGGTNFPVSLSLGESDTITVGSITYTAGNIAVKVWINHVNGGTVTDENSQDDTISKSIFVCNGGYNGLLSIGLNSNNDFQTLTQFYEALNICGVSGDITLAFDSGIYAENLDFSNNAAWMSNYTLTITSTTNNANDVIIRPLFGVGITLSQSNNIIIKNITVDATQSSSSGIRFEGTCSNVLIRDCRLLKDTVSDGIFAVSPIDVIARGNNISIIHNFIEGGMTGIFLDEYLSANSVVDSNIIQNNSTYGIYNWGLLNSISYNTILTRTTNIRNANWMGILTTDTYVENIIGNRIIQRNAMIPSEGIHINQDNYSHNPSDTSLVANNEIILNGTGTGIVLEFSRAKLLHNSIYMGGVNRGTGIGISSSTRHLIAKNNNIVMNSIDAVPIGLPSSFYSSNQYDIDYNNLYAPTYVGSIGELITTMATWQQKVTTDQHSVRVLPHFIDSSISLELSGSNNSLSCPATRIFTDIRGFRRPNITTMGAYIQSTDGQDLMLLQLSPWNEKVVNNQTIPVNVDLFNMGTVPLTSITLGWSVNGIRQSSVPLILSPTLNSFEERNVVIGTFPAINADTFDIVVWIETANGQQDMVNWNDTLSATSIIYPLAEFVAPFVEDTIYVLDFDVSAKIRSETGAPVSPPELYLETIVNNSNTLYDTIPMLLQNNGIWQANIPQQYYGSKIIYSLTVSDTFQNTFTAIDSVYIQPVEFGKTDTVIIGTETSTYNYLPISMTNNYSWSRQIYLYREVCPDMPSAGTYITKIAWQSVMANAFYRNQTCYMRAIDDSIEITGYLAPLTNGVYQVWAGSLTIRPGWVEISLDTPFFLPAGKNLEIIWEHQNGSYTNSTHTWAYTRTQNVMTLYAQSSIFPTTAGTQTYFRPNIKITTKAPFSPYTGNNLSLISFPSPVPDFDNLCATDYAPVTIVIGNTGEMNYDFSIDTVALYYEIINPQQTKHTGYVSVHTGKLVSEKADTVTLMAALPVMYPGEYELKVWLESPVDNIIYDDTLVHTYIPSRVGLPVDEDFSKNFPTEFVSQTVNTFDKWIIISQGSGTDTAVKPVFGSGMLAFTGNLGAMTYLSTRQLYLQGTTFPTLEFWCFHDTIESEDYMDVRITTDGGTTSSRLLFLLKQDTTYGWKYYSADLTPYINGQCIQVLFEAMRMSPGIGSQYIDRIIINSQPDLEVSNIALPLQTACDLKNAELEVILSTVTNQAIDLSDFSASLAVEIPGYQVFPVLLQKRIQGLSSDTIRIPVSNLPVGNYSIKAYLTSPVDNLPNNDTAYYVVNINPKLTVTVNSITDGKNCFKKGIEVYQGVVLQNTGNLDLPGIELSLLVVGDNSTEMVKETKTVDLHVGDSILYPFENAYTVPSEATYQVQVFVWLECDSVLVNNRGVNYECVDLDNIFIVNIDNPVNDQTDTAGLTENIIVTIRNESDNKRYSNVVVTALIENEQGEMLASRLGTISMLEPLETEQFTFTERYTVPEDSVYYIRVYLNSLDIYPEDDTLSVKCYTVDREEVGISSLRAANSFTLSQNIPNPATNSIRIDYSVPEAGEVMFHVHSITGQLLYSQTIETKRGTNSIELNTTTFAAGVYFYSMEYKGQRLVRQLIISN